MFKKAFSIYKRYQNSNKKRLVTSLLCLVVYVSIISVIDYFLPKWNYAVTQFIYNFLLPLPILAILGLALSLAGSIILSKCFWLRIIAALLLLIYLPVFPILLFLQLINFRNHAYPSIIKSEVMNPQNHHKALIYAHGVREYEGEFYYYGGCSLVVQKSLELPRTLLIEPVFGGDGHSDDLYKERYDQNKMLIKEPNNCDLVPEWLSNEEVKLGKRTLPIQGAQKITTWVPLKKFQYSYPEFLKNEVETPVIGTLFFWYTLFTGTQWSFGR